jgi:hypothetical protein
MKNRLSLIAVVSGLFIPIIGIIFAIIAIVKQEKAGIASLIIVLAIWAIYFTMLMQI